METFNSQQTGHLLAVVRSPGVSAYGNPQVGHSLWKCCCNVKLNFTVGKEAMKGTERLLLLYINSEHTEREFTTSYSDMLKELAF